jgi:adenine-specific DNA-methyltransferase
LLTAIRELQVVRDGEVGQGCPRETATRKVAGGVMRYIGSKTASLPAIAKAIRQGGSGLKSLCDPFAGICTVSRHFKAMGWRVVTGDILAQSYALQVAHLELNRQPDFPGVSLPPGGADDRDASPHLRVLSHLNLLPGVIGFITREYSLAGAPRRLCFTAANARRIDRIRLEIEEWDAAGKISAREKCYLLACLLEASDRVANTAGTYYAYLKKLYRKARQRIRLRPLVVSDNNERNEANRAEAIRVVEKTETDVVYLDPPYNRRNYGAYYHLPETLALWDAPEVRGKCGMRGGISWSPFYQRDTASDALGELIMAARSKLIVVHYAEKGLVPHNTILKQLKGRGATRWQSWGVRAYTSEKAEGTQEDARHRLYWCVVSDRVVTTGSRS